MVQFLNTDKNIQNNDSEIKPVLKSDFRSSGTSDFGPEPKTPKSSADLGDKLYGKLIKSGTYTIK